MMKYLILGLALAGATTFITAQEMSDPNSLPYYEIPAPPQDFTAASMAARMIDGLGFRYYWATEGLRDEDLQFKPSEEARSVRETMGHIYGMSVMISNAILQKSEGYVEDLDYERQREATLRNFKAASDHLNKAADEELANMNIRFRNGSELPLWNLINGPISDCIWHCGQIVSFRRSSGNPFNGKVSLMRGNLRED